MALGGRCGVERSVFLGVLCVCVLGECFLSHREVFEEILGASNFCFLSLKLEFLPNLAQNVHFWSFWAK